MCPDQAPFYDVASDMFMGFVAAPSGLGGLGDCCDCYELSVDGFSKSAVVQVTSHGQVNGLFDLLVPGGGAGQFDGCGKVFPKHSTAAQDRFGGFHGGADCATVFQDFPQDAAACKWLFAGGFFPYPVPGSDVAGDAHATSTKRVECPAALNARSGCAASGSVPVAREPARAGSHPSSSSLPTVGTVHRETPPPPPPLPPMPPPPCQNKVYDQCAGGAAFKGDACCAPGTTCCIKQGIQWEVSYGQCWPLDFTSEGKTFRDAGTDHVWECPELGVLAAQAGVSHDPMTQRSTKKNAHETKGSIAYNGDDRGKGGGASSAWDAKGSAGWG